MARPGASKRSRGDATPSTREVGQGSGQAQIQSESDEERPMLIQDCPIAYERGFELTGIVLLEKFYTLFNLLGWNSFAHHPCDPCLAFVYEFYSNLISSTRPDEVKVCGKWVRYDIERINEVLGIPPLEEEDVLVRNREVDFTPDNFEMLHVLTLGKGGGVVPRSNAVKIGSLCSEANVWLKFLNGRIFGKIKLGETTMDQQIKLFYVLLGKRFNVGRLIYQKINQIKDKIRLGFLSKVTLAFPSLITMLCFSHNAKIPKGSYVSKNVLPIIDRDISSYEDPSVLEFHASKWGGRDSPTWVHPVIGAPNVPSPPHGDEELHDEGGERQEEHGNVGQGYNQGWHEQRYDDLVGRFDTMSVRMDGVYQRLDGVFDRMDGMSGRIDAMYGRFDGLQEELGAMRAEQRDFYGRMNAHFFPDPPPPNH